MPRTPIPLALSVLVAFAAVAAAQTPKPKPASSAEERFKPFRLTVDPTSPQRTKLTQMKNGTVNLDPVSKEDQEALNQMARSYVYPITHHELYLAPDGAELTPRSPDARTVAKVIEELRAQMLIVTPGAQLPLTQLAYTREFGTAVVKAITEVLEKGPPTAVRVNALRMLEVVAESGAPAAWDKTIELLKQKDDKAQPLEVLYYALRAAEAAIGTYDKDRFKWVTKDKCFELVALVDEVAMKVPAGVAEKTYVPERPVSATLTAGGKPPAPAGELASEQVEAIRAFRVRAIRALARLRTDVVQNAAGDKERRPLHTLAAFAMSDPSVSPPPNFKEVGEAVIGLVTVLPSDTANANLLGVAIATGTADFASVKTAGGADADAAQATHWKVYGARMKAAFTAWEKDLQSPKVKLVKADKDTLAGLSQICVTNVFDPLTRQSDKGVAPGLNKAPVDDWRNAKLNAIKPGAVPLYSDSKSYTIQIGAAK